jgi:Fe-S-cluster containining protein
MCDQAQETVSIDFTVGIGDGKFSATAVVPAGQTNLTQILPVIQSLEDSLIAGVGTQLGQAGLAISCKAGCGACCRQMVPLSIFEAEALSTWIRTQPEARQQELAGRFHQALLKLSAAGLIDRMVNEDWFAETEAARQLALEYLYQRVPCPFLENESCSIHPIRPLICREYLVTSEPVHCFDPAILQTVPVLLPLYFSRVLNRIGAELENDNRGWIPLVFLFAWMKSGAQPGDSISGDGPEVLYEFVKRISEGQVPLPPAEHSAEDSAGEPL